MRGLKSSHGPGGQRGFTLIELLVGVATMSLVVMAVMPSVKTYVLDVKITTAAQAFFDGAQLARSEALRRNAPVTIELTDSNRGWKVKTGPTDSVTEIASKSSESASVLSVDADDKTAITFNSQGQTTETEAVTVQFLSSGTGSCSKDGGTQRCMNVGVSPGGQVRMCDAAISAEGDNRKC